MQKNQSTGRTVCRVISILVSLFLLIGAGCFLGGALYLLFTGEETPYTRDRVGHVLRSLALPLLLSLLGIVAGSVIAALYPYTEKKDRARGEAAEAAARAAAAVHTPSIPREISEAIVAEAKKRRRGGLFLGGALLLFAVLFFLYSIHPAHFPDDPNAAAWQMAAVMGPLFCLSVVGGLFFARAREASWERTVALYKEARSRGASPAKKAARAREREARERRRRRLIQAGRAALLLTGGVCLIVGIAGGGMRDVLEKAAKICTECIGLG